MSGADFEIQGDNDPVEKLKDKILGIWSTEGEPLFYPLSNLGSQLGYELKVLQNSTGMKLAEFIKNHLSDRLKVVDYGDKGNLRAIVAAGNDISGDDISTASSSQASFKRFHRALWAAFIVPIDGEKRLFNIESRSFRDIGLVESHVENNEFTVRSEDVVGSGAKENHGQIAKNIMAWLQRNNLKVDDFLENGLQNEKMTSQRSGKNTTALEILILSLNSAQLKSTTLSLDVIASLAARVV